MGAVPRTTSSWDYWQFKASRGGIVSFPPRFGLCYAAHAIVKGLIPMSTGSALTELSGLQEIQAMRLGCEGGLGGTGGAGLQSLWRTKVVGGDEAMRVYDSPTQRLATWFHSTGAEASSHCHRLRTVSWTRSEVLCSWILMSYIKRISFVNLGPGSCSCRRWHRVLSSVKLKLRASTWGAIDDVIFRGKTQKSAVEETSFLNAFFFVTWKYADRTT